MTKPKPTPQDTWLDATPHLAANTPADPFPNEQARWNHTPTLPPHTRLVSDTRDLTTGGLPVFAMRFGPYDSTEVMTGDGTWTRLTNTARLMDRATLKEHNRQVRLLRKRNGGYITPQPSPAT